MLIIDYSHTSNITSPYVIFIFDNNTTTSITATHVVFLFDKTTLPILLPHMLSSYLAMTKLLRLLPICSYLTTTILQIILPHNVMLIFDNSHTTNITATCMLCSYLTTTTLPRLLPIPSYLATLYHYVPVQSPPCYQIMFYSEM